MKNLNDEVRVNLKDLVTTYGTELCTDIRKTEGLLRDKCGNHKREISVLISAMKNRVPEEILGFKGDTIDQLKFSRLVNKLQDNEGTAEEYARWAVESWVVALGKKTEAETNHTAKPTTGELKGEEEPKSGASNTYPKEKISRPPVGTTVMYTNPETGMEFVYVEGGCYEMGDTFGDGRDNEKPVHEVCVDGFYIGKYQVTQGQWEDVMGYNPSRFKKMFKRGRNYPVENVKWNDIQTFIKILNRRTGKIYRLPTEAEWEYAARSGGKKEKWAGTSKESELSTYAWYTKNAGSKTHPVGKKKPNGLEIYDMSGNVSEWCQDTYNEKAYQKHCRNNPINTESDHHVVRGGCWNYFPRDVTASFRDPGDHHPDFLGCSRGFRLVLPQLIFRSTPQKRLSGEDALSMFKNNDFFDVFMHKSGRGFSNNYELQNNGKVVYDRASGLMWQQSGSDKAYSCVDEAIAYVTGLNRDNFAGYSNWRLPTLEDAMSLMETSIQESLFIDPVFDAKQRQIWTSDEPEEGDSSNWVVYFMFGSCGRYKATDNYVRAVR